MSREWQRKQTQVVWADLEPWVQQLYEDHHIRCEFTSFLPVADDSIPPGVWLEAYTFWGVGGRKVVKRDWATYDPTVSGVVEQLCLRMISKLLLEVEADKERAERQAPSPLWPD